MKLITLFKYIFVIFVIAIVGYAGYKIYRNKNQVVDEQIISGNEDEEYMIKDIRLAVANFDNINPLITNNKEILNIDQLIFEPLFTISKDYKLQNCIASEWSKTGDNTYVIKVDTTIKWHDGAYLTAKDVKFTIDKLKEGNSVYKANVDRIESAEVIDSSTIKITTDQITPFFEYNLTFPIMSDLYYFNEDFYTSPKVPIGTGRFKIADITPNTITLTKNTEWKKLSTNESKLDTIRVNLYSSMGEEYNAFKLGNVDIINTTNADYQSHIGNLGFNVTESPGREFDYISLNCQDEILQDKFVRQAIGYAIDKDNIVSAVYNNQKMVANYPLDYGSYLNISESNSSGYNPEQAKKVLEDNGWIYQNNKWRKNIDGRNQNLTLNLSVQDGNEARVRVAEIIKEQLENIGILVNIERISNERYQSYLADKNYQMLITGILNSYSPDLTYFYATGNIENYYNDEVLSIIGSNISSKNTDTLSEGYKRIYDIYKDEVPFIGLYRNRNRTISNTSVVGDIVTNNFSTLYNVAAWYRR